MKPIKNESTNNNLWDKDSNLREAFDLISEISKSHSRHLKKLKSESFNEQIKRKTEPNNKKSP